MNTKSKFALSSATVKTCSGENATGLSLFELTLMVILNSLVLFTRVLELFGWSMETFKLQTRSHSNFVLRELEVTVLSILRVCITDINLVKLMA